MEANTDFTAANAPILCLVCTASACGSQLIATVNVRLATPLADVRRLLISLASGGDGGPAAVREAPTNVAAAQAQRIIAAPLHPFDFTETFSFVHGGGCRAYTAAQEQRLCVEDVLPRYPRFGIPPAALPQAPAALPPPSSSGAVATLMAGSRGAAARLCSSSCTRWIADAAPPVAVVRHPRGHHARRAGAVMAHHDGGVSEVTQVAPQKRFALAALFVAPGDRAEGGLRAERVVAERLQLQLPDPLRPLGGLASGAGLFSPAALAATYGRPFRVETWCAAVTRWNGNTEDLLGRTPLYEAAQVGNEAAVRFLLSQSYIVVDAQERQSGESALHAAVRSNFPAVVRLLLEEGGANPLLANRSGDTPLHVALQRRRAVVVGMLCSRLRTLKIAPAALAEASMANNMGHTPAFLFELYSPSLLDLCRDGASLVAVKALVHHYFFNQAEVTARDGMTGQSVLHAAAAGGSVEVLRYVSEGLQPIAALLSDASSPSSTAGATAFPRSLLYDSQRQNPLHVAAAGGNPVCVQYLLEKLPLRCLAEVDLNGNTPLLLAMKRRRWRVVELLTAQCPAATLAASTPDRHGLSALHIACGLGLTRVAAVLLRHHGAGVQQNSLTASAPPPSASPSPTGTGSLWGPHWENTCLVRHAALRGRLRRLEEREAKRQEQRRQRQPSAALTLTTVAASSSRGGTTLANSFADYSDPVAIAKAAKNYVYGGGRLGYTPLRCALLYATAGSDSAVIPAELLQLLCEHGAVHDGAAEDTRDLVFYLLTHRHDAHAEALLAWVMQHCAAAVAVLRRDNVLLCRLCALHDDVAIRWCVEAQLCDVQSRHANPLVACAAAGNASAAAFLIHCAAADVNALTGPQSALAVSLCAKEEEVAQVLIVSRAQLTSGDGSWSALQVAVAANLESVVRGLLGTHAIDPLDVSLVLLTTLQGQLYASPQRRREQAALAVFLARAYDPTRTAVHPTELLHLSAAVGCFAVTRALVDRLLALPSTVWAELLSAVPAPPPPPLERIEPTMAPLTVHFPRLLPNRVTGKGGLYHPPRPFYRLVVAALRRETATTLLHRLTRRDVYSYAVAAQEVELVQALRCGLRLPPWPQRDVRGWTVMDYVMAQAAKTRTPLLALFVASGIVPSARHGRRVLPKGDYELVRAVHEAQQRHHQQQRHQQQQAGEGASTGASEAGAASALAMTAHTLARLVGGGCERSPRLVSDVLDAFLDMHQLRDFRGVPCQWLAPLVRTCAAMGRVDVLTVLKERYGVDLAQSWADAPPGAAPAPTPLLLAVQGQHTDVITYLLRAGCAVHARGTPTPAMAARVPLKNVLSSTITPLALAAWRQDVATVRLLLAASPPLLPEDTEESVGHTIGDALRGLVGGATLARARSLPPPPPQHAALADCVRALARAGHPLRFASTLRMAVAKGLVEVAETVVECYGSAALLADLVVASPAANNSSSSSEDEAAEETKDAAQIHIKRGVEAASVYARPAKHAHLSALAFFAATPRLVPVLRSLLVEHSTDEYRLESWRLTDFSRQLQSLHRRGGRRGLRLTSAAVDYALQRGCADGALLLLALGLMGRGALPLPRPGPQQQCRQSAVLCVRVAHVLRHWHARRHRFQAYTVLHSAAELGYGNVVEALTAEVQALHLSTAASVGAAGQQGRSDDFALSVPVTAATTTAPSLFALAATHADGWAWLPLVERVAPALDPRSVYVAARDLFALIFSGFGVSHAVDQVCRRAAQHKLLGDVFSVFESTEGIPSSAVPRGEGRGKASPPPATRGSAVSAAFVVEQLRSRPHALYLAGGTYVLTGLTSLTCAIAAGRYDWVQYLSVHGPSLVYHRATAARLRTCQERRAAEAERQAERRAVRDGEGRLRPWRPRDAPARRPRRRRHHCSAVVDGAAPQLSTAAAGVCRMDALTLCMAQLAESVLRRRDTGAAQVYEEMLTFLLAWPGATPRKETINMLAVVAACLRRWPLLLAIMQHADRLYSAGLMEEEGRGEAPAAGDAPPRYFFPLLPEEIPVVLAGVIGSARHVMHAVARAAPKAVLIEVARHCQRSDVEAAVDARGCTSVYHALQHHQPFAVETFAALRVPMGRLCRTRQQQTPLMVAAAQGRTALVTALLRPDRVNQQDRAGRTALMLAAAHGHRAAVEVLLAANADAALCDAHGHTAAMLAALQGHDELAAELVQHFSNPGDLLTTQSSVLHCAAVGGCWRTAAAALKAAAVPQTVQLLGSREESAALLVLREDSDGHTPLFLAHAFGSAQVLRELLRVLFCYCSGGSGGQVRTVQGLLEVHGGGGAVERRLLRSDSTLERYGWLAGVLEINAALAGRVREAYAQSPAAHGVRAGEMPYLPVAPSLRQSTSLLQWCVQTRNTVGLRVLADFNVADDCRALHRAAASGCRSVVEVLVELEMSDPSVPDAQTGRYAFETAAMLGHTACAAYLLTHTAIDLASLLGAQMSETAPSAVKHNAFSGEGDGGGGDGDSAATLFHVLAGHCGGELLVQFLEQTLQTATRTYVLPPTQCGEQSGAEVVSRLLCRALQAPAGASCMTPLEYAIAMGDAAAVLRTAQVLQRLHEAAGAVDASGPAAATLSWSSPWGRSHPMPLRNRRENATAAGDVDGGAVTLPAAGVAGAGTSGGLLPLTDAAVGAVFVSTAFLQWVPTLSPAVRTVLFDVFGMWEVAGVAGFESSRPATTTAAAAAGNGGGSAAPPHAVTTMRRMRFADVRLVGIATLQHDAYCAELVHRCFNPDHEREVLRLLLQSFPYKIRYEPEAYQQCSLALQTQLLQWLGSSLVLGSYDAPAPSGVPTEVWAATARAAAQPPPPGFETVEVQVVQHRSEQFVELGGGSGASSALRHSLYVSTAQHALVVPEVMASLPAALRRHREGWAEELQRLSAQATRLLQRQPHPVLQRSTVTVEWDLMNITESTATSVLADVRRYGSVFWQLCEAMRNFCDWVRGPLHSLLCEVDAADLSAVVVSVRHGATAGLQVCFRYVAEERAVTRFPSADRGPVSAITFKGDVYPSCCVEFNEVTHTDVAFACGATIGRAVAADVALVRVHHARDHFLADARRVMRAPRGVAVEEAGGVAVATEKKAAAQLAAGGDAEGLNRSAAAAAAAAEASATTTDVFLQFKLELEGTTLDRMPVHLLERLLLEEAVTALDAVVSPCPAGAMWSGDGGRTRKAAVASPLPEKRYDVFHSAAIVSAALVRRLKTVLVLFTTRREAMVRLSGDKLMLCFTPAHIPSSSDIAAELTQTLVQEESDLYRRRLAEVYERMQERLSSYLPNARLTVDLESMARLAPDTAHLLSALRLLVHQQSAWVLQRLVEGVSIGWDTDLGAVVRRHVTQVTLMLEPALYGSCHLTPSGAFVYYCPLLCLERQPAGALTPSSLPSWQLLSAQHIASLLLLQLSTVEPRVPQFVDATRSVACWTAARRLPRRVLPGAPVVIEVQAFNLLHEPLRRGGESLTLMGQVDGAAVQDCGKGRYRIRFAAPQRAGLQRLFILLHGQPIANSPLWYGVRPGPVDLARTTVDRRFDAVVIGVPFTVLLRLHDAAGNRLHAAPQHVTVTTSFPASMVALEDWSLLGPSVLGVTLRVLPSVTANTAVAVPLTLEVADGEGDGASATVTLPPFPCVDKETYRRVCQVRRGLTSDHGSPTNRRPASGYPGNDGGRSAVRQPSSLFFRRSMRRVVKKKLAAEAAALGGALEFRYPRNAAMAKLERPSRGKKGHRRTELPQLAAAKAK